jgi:hypothetical protein
LILKLGNTIELNATRSGYTQKCKVEEDRSVVILTTGSIKNWRREFYRSLTILIEGASIT